MPLLVLVPYTAAVIQRYSSVFAVVDIAGFQEKVSEGDKLRVPSLPAEEGKSLSFDKVLLLAKSADDVKVGTPYVAGAAVEVKVLRHAKGDKIRVYKMHRRKRYRRTHGHRQGFTEIEVTKIKASGAVASAPAAKKEVVKK
ncbi:MAG TPA: 50S ribosomal protein L21 [Candidatus Peribacteraceae bacterium]|nr:50S ribosomal protein L21 [Candidatus Peribacteraceae bacterium]